MRWYGHRGMDLPEEYMRCHCGKELETYEQSMQCEQYKELDPAVYEGSGHRAAQEG